MCYVFMNWGFYSEGRAVLEGLKLVVGVVVMGQSLEVIYREISVQVWGDAVLVCLCVYFCVRRDMQRWGRGGEFKQGVGADSCAIPGAGNSDAPSSFFFCVPEVFFCVRGKFSSRL